jgi:hypothetical protein
MLFYNLHIKKLNVCVVSLMESSNAMRYGQHPERGEGITLSFQKIISKILLVISNRTKAVY